MNGDLNQYAVGAGLRILRVQSDLTQQDVADWIGVGQISVSRWERGKRRLRPEVADRLVDAITALASKRSAEGGGS